MVSIAGFSNDRSWLPTVSRSSAPRLLLQGSFAASIPRYRSASKTVVTEYHIAFH